jgi:uncharacterized membrane protein YtjA (UPF0391 family)
MLRWIIIFAVVALVAAGLGYSGLADTAGDIAGGLTIVYVVLGLASLLFLGFIVNRFRRH